MAQEINENKSQEPREQKLSDEEIGARLNNALVTYLDKSNAAMIRYRDALQKAITEIENINAEREEREARMEAARRKNLERMTLTKIIKRAFRYFFAGKQI